MSFDVCDNPSCVACNLKLAIHALHEETGDTGVTLQCIFAAVGEVTETEIHAMEVGLDELAGTVH